MVFSGQLTETLQFYTVTETQSSSGYKQTTETLKFSCRAERLKNKETYTVDAEEVFHSTELTFRLRARDIVDTDIVKYQNERYRITSIDKYPRENQMTIIIAKINE